jgi:hypothetical protein
MRRRSNVELNPEDLAKITDVTLSHYNEHAEDFWEGTREYASLKPGGVLFSSNPHGHNEEGWNGGRYGVYHDLDTWRSYVSAAGFVEINHYYRPTGLPRERQPWLASV